MKGENILVEELFIKNMFCGCSVILLKEKLELIGLEVIDITLGKAIVKHKLKRVSHEIINKMLVSYNFELLHTREDKIVEEIKLAVIELIHHLNNVNSIVRKSDYIVEKLGLSYNYLSKVFSDHEHQTLEKYIILQKIERIKHLIDAEEFTLSEISYMMDYSSVHYLSNQFKANTGMTVSQYKESDRTSKKAIDDI